MKILLTGAAGMLGTDVAAELIKQGHELIQTDINQRLPVIDALNVADRDAVLRKIEDTHPDYVFHLAAETNVDLCQKQPKHAYSVNSHGTRNIALACKKFDIRLLYVSTAAVFDGEKEKPYVESDKPKPANIYGDSKWQGELMVGHNLSQYFIIRAGWMVGGWEIDKKFVYKIIRQLKDGKRELMVVGDKFGTPTFTKDFARNLMNVINTGKYGLYHMANKGACSRYDMALKIVEFMGLRDEVQVEKVSSDRFPLPAPRPRSEMLENYKLGLLGLNNMPRWEKSLEEYVKINKDK